MNEEETMPQIDRLNEIRAILRDRNMDRRDVADWCQRHLAAINSGGPEFVAARSAAEEERCR